MCKFTSGWPQHIESDPLFFMAQRGEATQQQWLDKVAEIKARWPA